jgi:hypothetical protein
MEELHMARKKASPAKTVAPRQPLRICFERIIPDDLDPERSARRAVRDVMAARSRRSLNVNDMAHFARMAIAITKKWQPGTILKCRFLDGTSKMRTKVEAIAHQWEQYANIKFKFVSSGAVDIRISFYADAGSWSAVGRDARNQPTMNYGWLRDDTDDEEYSRVVLHEFGHALGCIHEHQQPKFDRVWNQHAVMQAFQGPPNYWNPEEIRQNVLLKYSPQGIAASRYDPKSIMLYAFDGSLFSDGKGPTNSNSKVSSTDINMIKSMYP